MDPLNGSGYVIPGPKNKTHGFLGHGESNSSLKMLGWLTQFVVLDGLRIDQKPKKHRNITRRAPTQQKTHRTRNAQTPQILDLRQTVWDCNAHPCSIVEPPLLSVTAPAS